MYGAFPFTGVIDFPDSRVGRGISAVISGQARCLSYPVCTKYGTILVKRSTNPPATVSQGTGPDYVDVAVLAPAFAPLSSSSTAGVVYAANLPHFSRNSRRSLLYFCLDSSLGTFINGLLIQFHVIPPLASFPLLVRILVDQGSPRAVIWLFILGEFIVSCQE